MDTLETLFDEPDNIEIIRDEIAAILAVEIANQYAMAQEKESGLPENAPRHAKDFNIGVYVENDDPLQLVNENSNPFPCVNISLEKTAPKSGSTRQNHRNMTASFFIDVYATGNTDSTEDAGFRASLKAWKTARIVRNILNAERYTYLNMHTIVGSRELENFQGGEAANGNSAIRVKMVRITLAVEYSEDVEVNDGVKLMQIDTTISDDGKVQVAAA